MHNWCADTKRDYRTRGAGARPRAALGTDSGGDAMRWCFRTAADADAFASAFPEGPQLMARRDDLAKLRGLAGESGYRVEKAYRRNCWRLVAEKTGVEAIDPRDGSTAFTVASAIAFLGRLKRKPEKLRGDRPPPALTCTADGDHIRQSLADRSALSS